MSETITETDGNHEVANSALPQPKNLVEAIHQEIFKTCGRPNDWQSLHLHPTSEWTLLDSGEIDEAKLSQIYAKCADIEILDEEEYRSLEPLPEVTYDFLHNSLCLPLTWDKESIILAVATPYQLGKLSFTWQSMFQKQATFLIARRSLIERQITANYDTALQNGDDWQTSDDKEQALKDLAREAPIVRLVNDMLTRAVEMAASDIHVEPSDDQMTIRYRIDGVLQTIQTPSMAQYPAISSRLKLLAGLNIAERRLPQDGRIDLKLAGAQLDIRVSSIPSMHGESIVLRLLQKNTENFELGNLGLLKDNRKGLETLFTQPHGMILVVGPTGSGKTTTLYCIMQILNGETQKIITIEDPVEYQLNGLTQIQVKSQIGLTFANGLRSIVRQDPDVILVGEIRDKETAEIAIQAALTGHLVLSTLHTNDAAGAISRLLDMGIESFLISSSLLGVLSQRLVRKTCTECQGTGWSNSAVADERKRCRNCLGRGYRGRIGIYELLTINDELRKAINQQKDSSEIAKIAQRNGMKKIREDGMLKVKSGITTQAEITRVCKLDFELQTK